MKAIIPAAGYGTRLRPLTDFRSKEMLKIDGVPAIECIIRELRQCGIHDICVISRPDKLDLNNFLEKHRNIEMVYQQQPLGLGHAITLTADWCGNEDVLIALPDVLTPIYETYYLLAEYKRQKTPIIGLTQVKREMAQEYGIITEFISYEKWIDIQGMVEKPPYYINNLAISGRYVVNSQIFTYLNPANSYDLVAALRDYPRLLGINMHNIKDIGTIEGYWRVCNEE